MKPLFCVFAAFVLVLNAHAAPEPILLWSGTPPLALEAAPPETLDANGRIQKVSVPAIVLHLPPKQSRPVMAIIVCAGGGYGTLDWKTHVIYAADVFNPLGVAIEMPRAIKADLEKLGVPVRMMEFDEGAHGVGNLIPQRVANGFPPAKWPQLLLGWLDEVLRQPNPDKP